VTEIALQPLDAAETANLAAQVAAQRLDIESVMRLYHETEGNPLFIVEMMRAGFGLNEAADNRSGDTESAPVFNRSPLPPKVQAVITGRLAKLSPAARDLVSLAAAVGREFMLDVLVHASNAEEDDIIQALDELWQKRIVREQEAKVYDFTHDKLREVAYAEISAPQRRLQHQRIARAIEQVNADNPDPVSTQIASHYDRAGMIRQAIPYYQRAAAVAQHMYANEDAINLLNRALTLLELLPAGTRRDRQELTLRLALAPLIRVTKGWATPELELVLNRALTLCDSVGDDAQRAQILYGLQSLHVVQAKLEDVQFDLDQLRRIYQRTLNSDAPRLADMILAGTWLHLGRFSEASNAFEQIIEHYDPSELEYLQESQGVNYAAHARAWQAHALWGLGYPQRAISRALEAVHVVREPVSPFNQALVATYLAMLHQLSGDSETARAHAEKALTLTKEYKAHYYHSWAVILVNYAVARDDPTQANIAHLREAAAAILSFIAGASVCGSGISGGRFDRYRRGFSGISHP
jgi:predicted ATPase